MKIYTKTGDKGQTRLVGGSEVSKTDPRLEAYGTVDELNASLALVMTELLKTPIQALKRSQDSLLKVQNELFNIGSHLACETKDLHDKLPSVHQGQIEALEDWIDELEAELPPLRQFILPGGSELAARLHLARTVCRRAERACAFVESTASQIETSKVYLNRLSDLLFVLSRYCNLKLGHSDVIWDKDPS
jgi:cob(I)alamin adenosyltransferase